MGRHHHQVQYYKSAMGVDDDVSVVDVLLCARGRILHSVTSDTTVVLVPGIYSVVGRRTM